MRNLAYATGLLLALATALPAYVSSTYLSDAAGENVVGSIYALGAIMALVLLTLAPLLIRFFKLHRLMLISGLLTSVTALVLAAKPSAFWIIITFALFYALTIFLRLLSDFYLEETTDNKATGTTRGIFLTLINLGWLASPLLAALLIENGGFRLLYITAGLLFMPLGLLVMQYQTKSGMRRENVWHAFQNLWQAASNKRLNLRRILLVDLWLNIFYALMVVYMPIYLHQHVGLDWSAIGIIFTWMLLPFLLLDYVLGWLADKKYGEKEILLGGIIIAGVATILVSTVSAPVIWLWSALLFFTRVGAASIEVMKETYLFKKIDGDDLDILSLSRNLIPIAYLIGPLIAFVILYFLPLPYIFTLLGLSAFLLLPIVWQLADTK